MIAGTLKVEELDRKPSSCPFLFTWNGSRFEFITDFLGGGEMGYLEEPPGERNTPDPVEYVRVTGDQLRPRDGKYELRVTNELEESMFLDRAAADRGRASARRRGLAQCRPALDARAVPPDHHARRASARRGRGRSRARRARRRVARSTAGSPTASRPIVSAATPRNIR